MRDIKFRAWDDNRMILLTWDWFDNETIDQVFRTDRFTLMQYTGLKDKNGAEIYEGDIIQWNQGSYKITGDVHWRNHGWQPFQGLTVLCTPTENDCEVIGNIYENPELMEKGAK